MRQHRVEGLDHRQLFQLVEGERPIGVPDRTRRQLRLMRRRRPNAAARRPHRRRRSASRPRTAPCRHRPRPSSFAEHRLRAAASAAVASPRLSLSALVSSTSSLTEPLLTRGAMNSTSCRSRSVKPRRESTISTTPARLRRTLEVVGHHLLPAQLRVARDRGVAIAWQVGEKRVGSQLRAELEEVDVLRAPRRLRREGEALLLRQRVDRGRLAGVGAADEGDLRQLGRGSWSSWLAVVRKRAVCVQRERAFFLRRASSDGTPRGGDSRLFWSAIEDLKAMIVKSPGFA